MTDTHESPTGASEHTGGGFASGVVIGAAIGALATYLMSSPDGKDRAKQLLEDVQKALKDIEKNPQGVLEKAKEMKEAVVEKVHEAATSENFSSKLKTRFFKKKGKNLSSLW